MEVEPVTVTSPRPVRRAMLTQRWSDLTFLHWPVAPDRVAALLPPGTRPDVIDGISYVGLVPFRMSDTGVLAGPSLPYLGTFAETNVRLYSVDDQGRRGVVFLSLDAGRLIPALVGRLGLRMPYVWSRVELQRRDGLVTYRCDRRGRSAGVASELVVRPGPRIREPGPLQRFLTARWGLHVRWHGRTLHVPNEHPPWPLHQAELLELADDLVPASGLIAPGTAPTSVLFSPGVPVRFGWPEPRGSELR